MQCNWWPVKSFLNQESLFTYQLNRSNSHSYNLQQYIFTILLNNYLYFLTIFYLDRLVGKCKDTVGRPKRFSAQWSLYLKPRLISRYKCLCNSFHAELIIIVIIYLRKWLRLNFYMCVYAYYNIRCFKKWLKKGTSFDNTKECKFYDEGSELIRCCKCDYNFLSIFVVS